MFDWPAPRGGLMNFGWSESERGLNPAPASAYSEDVRASAHLRRRKGNPGFGWVVDILWPDGDTEVIKGFATEKAAADWIAEHSKGWQENNK
jgi:hypothetical protein